MVFSYFLLLTAAFAPCVLSACANWTNCAAQYCPPSVSDIGYCLCLSNSTYTAITDCLNTTITNSTTQLNGTNSTSECVQPYAITQLDLLQACCGTTLSQRAIKLTVVAYDQAVINGTMTISNYPINSLSACSGLGVNTNAFETTMTSTAGTYTALPTTVSSQLGFTSISIQTTTTGLSSKSGAIKLRIGTLVIVVLSCVQGVLLAFVL